MATASVSFTSECCICFETFNIPKILTCGHTFCLECIQRLIGDKTETFPCPTCKQDVEIPEGGAKSFTTNCILKTSKYTTQLRDQPLSTTQPKCPKHNQRAVDYYCNNCNIGLCFRCIHIIKQHEEHETLDIECDETRYEAIEQLQNLQELIQNKIKNLDKSRSTLLESFEQLKSLCEESCTKVTEATEQIVSDLRKSCEQIIKDIRKNLEENRSKVEDREKEIRSEINVFESDMELISSPSTETTLNILLTLHRLVEIEKLDKSSESRKDYNLCIQYLQWAERDFSLDIDQIGSVIFKSFHIPGSYKLPIANQFWFNVRDIEKNRTGDYNSDKFRNNNLVWSCVILRTGDGLYIGIELLPDDYPKLDYCSIDGRLSLLNIHDDFYDILRSCRNKRLMRGDSYGWIYPITWSKLTDKNIGYLIGGRIIVQFVITQITELKMKL